MEKTSCFGLPLLKTQDWKEGPWVVSAISNSSILNVMDNIFVLFTVNSDRYRHLGAQSWDGEEMFLFTFSVKILHGS